MNCPDPVKIVMLVSVNGKAVKGSSLWQKKDNTSWLYKLSGSREDCYASICKWKGCERI